MDKRIYADITDIYKDMLECGFTPVLLLDKFPNVEAIWMIDRRPKVSKLTRIGPPQNGGWFYYSPDGHAIGPFDYEEEMEADIKKHYKES